ncbi:plasmid stabilization protein [soil metagenome]
MATLTVRNLDSKVSEGLKALGARHGRSMEAEAREILATAVERDSVPAKGLATLIRERFAHLDTSDIDFSRSPEAPHTVIFEE